MFFRLLLAGLVLIPFFEAFLYLLIPGAKVPEWIDMRVTKEYLAVGMSMALTIISWIEYKALRCPNIWALAFIGFLFLNLSKAPIAVTSTVVEVARIGSFPGTFKAIVFFLLSCAIYTADIRGNQINAVIRAIGYGGAAMAFYMIIQALRLDQIYMPMTLSPEVKSPAVAGFFGQPTLAVPYLSLSIPAIIHLKRWFLLGVVATAMLLTGSDFSVVCLIFLAVVYLVKHRKYIIATALIIVPSGVALLLSPHRPWNYLNFNGRIEVWKQIIQDVFSGQINGVSAHIGMTGAGLESFGTIFTALHRSPWTFAHNEYLQILWTCGVIGLAIFLMIHFDVFKTAWKKRDIPEVRVLSLSLLMLCVCACGTFVWQLGTYQYFSVVIAGLIYQIETRKGISL